MRKPKLGSLFTQIAMVVGSLPAAAAANACGGSTEEGTIAGSGGGNAGGTNGRGGSAGAGNAGTGYGGASAGGSSVGGSAGGGVGGIAGYGGSGTAGSPATGGTAGTTGTGGTAGCFTPGQITVGADCTGAGSISCGGQIEQVPLYCIQADGTISVDQCQRICGLINYGYPYYGSCWVQCMSADSATVQCPVTCVIGRRPYSFDEASSQSMDAEACELGPYFARSARLEAASVVAFRDLRKRLAELGAPRKLLRALSRAARDEVRHTRATRALALHFGTETHFEKVPPQPARSLEELAVENAVEGCVRETYGALIGIWQARAAKDHRVAAAMRRIARDETRHAELSWAIHRWLEPRLSRASRARVAAEQRASIAQLTREIRFAPAPELADQAGLPTAQQAGVLLAALYAALWRSNGMTRARS
jgi:hypothetical protein